MIHARFILLSVQLVVILSWSPAFPQDRPLPPAEAAARMTLPDGFRATLFAGEPDVVQPIAFTFDDRGRLWVVECVSYPKWLKAREGKDRILIFEDTDNDGRFDRRTVFWDKGANLTGIQLGFGGVWLCATPHLLFLPDRDGDDKLDGPPEVLLDGWDLTARHNVFNGLAWGPDGWLYGCNGILSNSLVGKPGTPAGKRQAINCGVWRYHPTRQVFEAVAHGTTNPWGLDFDDYGQAFITNCVIHHLWHVVPGAHFQRMFGQDFNPHLYRLMESCADHIHWGGGDWTSSRGGKGVHDQPGGGHAHAGCMVYLGDNWPDRYRNGVFTCNIHGSRVNHDTLERKGSGYVARHAKDVLLANDPWFRGLAIQYGPDGGVFVTDWTDTGECHNYDQVHLSGRIYKVTYGKVRPFEGDLARLSDAELVERQLHKNDWHVRQARRLLQERAAAGRLAAETRPALLKMLRENPDVTRKLRALWALHVTGGLDEKLTLELFECAHDAVRAWAVQLELEDRTASPAILDRLAELAAKDPSQFVRLHLASGLQRLKPDQRWPIAEGLMAHGSDSTDASLALMIWYGIEPLATADAERFVGTIAKGKVPLVREFMTRRASSQELRPLVRLLGTVDDPAVQADVLRGMHEALKGLRQASLPEGWSAVYRNLSRSPNAEVREKALFLAVLFGDPQALTALRQTVMDPGAEPAARQNALQALIQKKNPDLLTLLQGLLGDRVLRGGALRGLAAFADDSTPRLILRHYPSFSDSEKADAIQTLASRPAFALSLLEAMEKGLVPRRDLSAFTVRQMQGLKDKRVDDRLAQVWGVIRPASQEKAALTARYKGLLTPDSLKNGNRSNGRAVYARACASCHILFGEGGKIGPELTGSQRNNLDYVLENLLDPSAVVARDYQVTVIQTTDGRVITGIILSENDKVVTVQTQNEVVLLPKSEIEERNRSSLSMMPEGLLNQLKDEEVRDLVAYLASPTQVPLPKSVGANGARRPNFLIILCDDLGYGDLACYGHPAIRTPHLDRLASQGVRLTACYAAAPVCSPSRAGLLTGRTPSRAGVYDWIPLNHPVHLRRGEVTVAALLQRAGYATALAGKWHCNGRFNSAGQPQPGDHGFDHWFATQNNAGPSHRNPTNFIRNGQRAGPLEGYSCQLVADEAIAWLKKRDPAKPFYLHVCFHEPHEPVASPPDLAAKYPQAKNPDQAEYFANVTNMDRAAGRLLAALDELKLADDTLVFFTSDNGPETLNRYGPGSKRSYGSPGPLRGMKLHLYEGGIRVPGILRWPGRIRPGQVVDEPMGGVDWLPTVCELAGVPLPKDKVIDGTSFVPVFEGKAVSRKSPLFWHYYRSLGGPKAALRDGDWKVLAHWDGPDKPISSNVDAESQKLIRTAKLTRFELYNVRTDPAEKTDLAGKELERLRRLAELLRRRYAEVLAEAPVWEFPSDGKK